MTTGVPAANPAENLRFVLTTALPAFARGVISPRPRVGTALAALGAPAWPAATLQRLRARHGTGPLWVRGISGTMLLLLSAQDVRAFFTQPAEHLALDSHDKTRALNVFEPAGVITTHGPLRAERRQLNDHALAHGVPAHPHADRFLAVLAEESAALARPTRPSTSRTLATAQLDTCMNRVSRRCVLGDAATDDEELTSWLKDLLLEANWLGLRRWRRGRSERTYRLITERYERYARAAGPDSLLGRAGGVPTSAGTDVLGQLHHWFLALDGLANVTARTLLALAAHPAEQAAVHAELDAQAVADRAGVQSSADAILGAARLRACVQESLRLWPLVPDFQRVTRTETSWSGLAVPPGTTVLVPMSFHQRDPEHVPDSDRFTPSRWLDGSAEHDFRLSPFSRGPGGCPGQELGLLLTTALCAQVLRGNRVQMDSPRLDQDRPLPRLIDTPRIRLTLSPR